MIERARRPAAQGAAARHQPAPALARRRPTKDERAARASWTRRRPCSGTLGEREAELARRSSGCRARSAPRAARSATRAALASEAGPALEALRPARARARPGARGRPAAAARRHADRARRPAPARARGHPAVRELRPSLRDLNRATPDLVRAGKVLNYLANELGYNPPGPEEGYLFWTAWFVHNAASVLSIEDAHGVAWRGLAMFSCSTAGNVLGSLPALRRSRPCRSVPEPAREAPGDRACSGSARRSSADAEAAPSPARIVVMIVFALSCFSIVLFLWKTFGGPAPLKAKGYRFTADLDRGHAARRTRPTCASRASRSGGWSSRERVGDRTRATIEMQRRTTRRSREDTRVTLRQKTLLGETYVELTPGTRAGEAAARRRRGCRASRWRDLEIDEVLRALDPKTRERPAALRAGPRRDARRARRGRERRARQPARFAEDAHRLLHVLDGQRAPLRRLVRDGGFVLDALGRRAGRAVGADPAGDRVLGATARAQRRAGGERAHPADHAARAAADARGARGARDRGRGRSCATCGPPAARSARRSWTPRALAPDLEGLFRDVDDVIDARRGRCRRPRGS